MWMKRVLGAMVLTFAFTAAVPAADSGGSVLTGQSSSIAAPDRIQERIAVTIWGRLREVIPAKVFPDGREIYAPDYAKRYFGVDVNGKTYRLDFGTLLDLWQRAEKCRNQRVIVEGELHGDRVVVSGLRKDPIDCARDKVAVEITGKLEIVEDMPKGPGPHFTIWKGHLAVRSNGQEFRLDLGGSGLDMWELDRQYRGQTVLVTGTLEGDRVRVSNVRAGREYVQKTVTVEIKAPLIRHLGRRCMLPEFEVQVNGRHYALVFGSNAELRKLAEKLAGQTVTVSGTLQGDDPTGFHQLVVTSLKADDTYLKETVEVEIKGRLSKFEDCLVLPPRASSVIGRWRVFAEGRTYQLDFTGNEQLKKKAEALRGRMVVLKGTLQNGVVKVTSLEYAAEPVFTIPPQFAK